MWCSASPSLLREPCSSAISSLRALCQWVWIQITRTHIQCVSFSGCLMELNSHSSCSAASISGRERFWIVCVCLYIVYLCDGTCSIRLTSRASNLSQKYYSFLCLPTFHLSNCSFLSLLLVALFLNPFLTEKYGSCSCTPVGHLSFSCSDLCYISTKYLMLSVSCLLLHLLDIWWDEAVGGFNLMKHTLLLLSLNLSLKPCQSSQSFALDAIDSLVRCGILIMEEVRLNFFFCFGFYLQISFSALSKKKKVHVLFHFIQS